MKKLVAVTALGPILAGAIDAAPASSASNIRFFQSPSKNIGCVIVRGPGARGARCDIAHHTYVPPPKPASCDLDWGNGLEVGRKGKGRFVCAGDTVLGHGPKLAYGDAIQSAGFRCKSAVSGVRCLNRKTQHGFKLSIQQAKVF
jgi:hypothetical protein